MSQIETFPHFDPVFPKDHWTLPFILERQAAARGEDVFLQWGPSEARYTFAETNAKANRLAHGLIGLGITKGESVVLFMPNSLDYVFAWFALNKIGAVEAPINTAYTGRFLEHQINLSAAETIVVCTSLLEHVRASIENMPKVRRIIVWSGVGEVLNSVIAIPGREVVRFETLYGLDESNPKVTVLPSDIAAIMFTSGTTGLSKGVLMPHAQLYLFAQIDCQGMCLTHDDVYMAALPLFHANSQFLAIYPCLIAGARCVLYEKFSASQWVDRLHESGATVTNMIGVMVPFIHAQPASPRDRGHCLERIFHGPTPFGILDDFKRRFGVEQHSEAFGQTEICLPIMTPLARKLDRPKGAAGLLLDQWFDVRIVDPLTDEELPVGQVGELVVRHKTPWTINAGYFGMPMETLKAWQNLWYHTGDAVKRDEQGWYYFIDRIKDSLRRRGENISSFEVEEPIREHPDVAEVAIVAVASEHEGGEDELKACIVLREGSKMEPHELIQWCVGRLPAFAVPRYIEFLKEFPKTPSEKVQKNKLRGAGITPNTWDKTMHQPPQS